ncbi:sphingosine N-acyltransferase family protein [Pleurotus pulmonarius]|nr:sphingosine N-acyltransferase lag1 [Pleurotus pulmonarius]KAF4600623.1 sphingosine N-acyltransferase lag1 [Pleurotus pulmonarius]
MMTIPAMLDMLPAFMVPFFTLQYPIDTPEVDFWPNASYYGTGPKDIYIVITCIAVMAIFRDFSRVCVLEPFARWKLTRDLDRRIAKREANGNGNGRALNGSAAGNGKANGTANGNGNGHAIHANGHASATPHSSKQTKRIHRSVLRFAEQGYQFIYYTLQWCYGFYVHRNLPTRVLDPTDVWLGYPHLPLAGPLKFYYLTQTAFYTHQILVLNAEARRKDHYQMLAHHIITVALMGASYFLNFTRVGCLIMVIMDWCDIFFPLAKMTSYLSISQTLTDIIFGFWVLSWAVTRHVLFIFVMLSTYNDPPRFIKYEWAPERGWFVTTSTMRMFNVMLFALQVLQIIWGTMIARIAWRVIAGTSGASDDRSDDEDDGTTEKKEE